MSAKEEPKEKEALPSRVKWDYCRFYKKINWADGKWIRRGLKTVGGGVCAPAVLKHPSTKITHITDRVSRIMGCYKIVGKI